MKLLSFEIKNYKCIESVVAPECSNLTTFIGRNSAGKTSILDALKYIRHIHQSFDDETLREVVHGGVKKYDDKFLFVNYLFEISENLRKEYVMHFLDVTEDAYTTFATPDLFKKIQISIKVRVKGTGATQLNYDNVFILDSMSISNTKGDLVSLSVNYLQNSPLLQVSSFDFIQTPKKRELTSDLINKQLQSVLGKKSGIDHKVRILVKKRLLQNEIDLAQEGSGIDQLFIIIWSIATAEKDTIWFLDEPELHLHPGAQKLLYDFFREESGNGKQIFVATHSMVFIHNSKPEEIYMVVDKEGKAQLIRISDLIPPEEIGSPEGINKIRNEVYKVLGYEPVFSFEPKTVVFVEGPADKGIIQAFTKKLLNKEIDENSTRFMITGSSSALESFGPLLVYSMMGKKAILIRDNDTNNPVELKEKMLRLEKQYRIQARINTPILSDDNFYFYPDNVSSIEYYLLDAKAIVDSYNLPEPEREAKIKEISDEIEKAKRMPRQGKFRAKPFLNSLCKRNFGSYQEVDSAIAIAENIPKEVIETYPELVTLINKIV